MPAYAGKQNGKDARDEKCVVEGVKDKKNGSGRDEPDEPKPHGRDKNRRREVENSSDSDSSEKHLMMITALMMTSNLIHKRGSRKNDSSDSSDEGPTYKTQKMKQPSRWHDSDDGPKHKSPKKKHSRNRRHDIDDEYSSDYGPKHETLRVMRSSKSRQHDSDTNGEEDDKRNPSEKRRNQLGT